MNLPTYSPHQDRCRRIESAVVAIKAILPLDLYPAHKRELLSVCLWKITEADGKAKVRFWSQGAIECGRGRLQHEHVHERRELIERMLGGEDVDAVVKDAIACMVTPEKHALLSQSTGVGWQRYLDAGIRVYDAKLGVWREGD